MKAGAFDALEPNRAFLLHNLEAVMDWAHREREARTRGQISIFDLGGPSGSSSGPRLEEVPDWEPEERLLREREALGFYLTGHPLSVWKEWLSAVTPYTVSNLAQAPEGQKIYLGAALGTIKTKNTRRGEKMAFVQLEDGESVAEAIVFPEVYARSLEFLEEGRLVLVRGTVEKEEGNPRVLVEDLRPLSKAPEDLSGRVVLALKAEGLSVRDLEALRAVLSESHGPCEINLELVFREGIVRIDLNGAFRIALRPELVTEARRFLGDRLLGFRLET